MGTSRQASAGTTLRTAGLCLALVALGALTRSVRLQAFDQHLRSQRYEDVYYLPPAEWLPVLSLGYTSALADLLWCRSLVYFGEELGQRGPVRHLFQYTDAILTLAPEFRAPYRWAATGIMYRPVDPTFEEGLRGADYLRRAVARWPQDGELHWDLGSFLKFELPPLTKDPKQKERLHEEAATHLHIAAIKGAGPPWLALNNSTLLTKLGRKEQAIRQLEEVYATVNDEQTRAAIAHRLAELRSETYVEALQVAAAQFEAEHAAAFPYLSSDLFFLVGEPLAARHLRDVAAHFVSDVEADEAAMEDTSAEP